MFYLWRRMGEEDRGRVWRLYGWFTALMACGSCVGAVAWASRMMYFVNHFKANATPSSNTAQRTLMYALAYSWLPAYTVTYAIEFVFMCAAKLMVLDRMSLFATLQDARMQKRWAAAGRVVMAAVVLGNAVGLAANAAAAVHYQKAAEAYSIASTYYAANKTSKDGNNFRLLSNEARQLAGSIETVQRFCEVAVLLLIVVAFVVVGVLCMRRFITSMTILDAAAQSASVGKAERLQMSVAAATGRALRLRMLGTTGFIFVTFLLRSVFSTMNAVVLQLRDSDNNSCPPELSTCDPSCRNMYTLISLWMGFTPEFQTIITLMSSPVAQLVALWGVTSKATLHLMNSWRRGNAMLNDHAVVNTLDSHTHTHTPNTL
jgi:hypothetical protein